MGVSAFRAIQVQRTPKQKNNGLSEGAELHYLKDGNSPKIRARLTLPLRRKIDLIG